MMIDGEEYAAAVLIKDDGVAEVRLTPQEDEEAVNRGNFIAFVLTRVLSDEELFGKLSDEMVQSAILERPDLTTHTMH